MLEETALWYEGPQAKITGANVVVGYHILYCQKVILPSYVFLDKYLNLKK